MFLLLWLKSAYGWHLGIIGNCFLATVSPNIKQSHKSHCLLFLVHSGYARPPSRGPQFKDLSFGFPYQAS